MIPQIMKWDKKKMNRTCQRMHPEKADQTQTGNTVPLNIDILQLCKRIILVSCLFCFFHANAQQQISGKVLNEDGNPLTGVNVYIPGTGTGTITDEEGNFSLEAGQPPDSVSFSHVGYQTKTMPAQQNMMVHLAPSLQFEEVIIKAVRAREQDPVVQRTVEKKELDEVYNGEQPAFFLDELTPAILSYSESGTRMANYSSMRLRGINQERINMTLNGVPLNDMIDHGVFFSNFTDLGNSFESVQVQRGVGMSSNGVASYAGSINFESVNIGDREKGGQLEMGLGSFNTYRLNSSLSSGMINDKWSFYGSYSKLVSDGFRYHTGTNASSFFFSGGYFGENDMIKITAFDARSRNGLGYLAVAESDLEKDIRTNYLNENDKDDFGQRLVQLQHTHVFNDRISSNASLYYGGASGDFLYTFHARDSSLSQINYPLANDHYGLIFNVFWELGDWNASSGIHTYTFHRVNEESVAPDFENPYYRETSNKKEISWFGKIEWTPGKWNVFADLQVRDEVLTIHPDYGFIGIQPEGDIEKNWLFLNPKAGVSLDINPNLSAYASLGRMGREPTKIDIFGGFRLDSSNYGFARSDAFDPEYVNDLEAGIKWNRERLALHINSFYMDFEDEIAPIGEVLAFGVQKRRNIPSSYRTGLELSWNYQPFRLLGFQGNMTYMQSRIESFTTGAGVTFENKTPVLSPEWIVNGKLSIMPVENITLRIAGKYISDSYLELTNDPDFILPSYFTANASLAYQWNMVSFRLEANNLLDDPYYSSGNPVDTNFDGISDEPGYFVNAGRNYFLSLRLDF